MKVEEKILGKNSLLELLAELEGYRSENLDMLTVYVTPQGSLPQIPEVFSSLIEKIKESPTGAIVFSWEKTGKNILIFPPFPIRQNEIFNDKAFRTEQLKEILAKDYTLGIILLRLGEYAVGIFKGNKLVLSKCGKRLVRAKHKKGGYSQARFQRIHEVQVNQFFNEVYTVLRSRFESYLGNFDYIIFGGPKMIIKKFQKKNHFLKKLSEKTLDKIVYIDTANKKVLNDILFEVWKTKVLFL